MQLVFPSQRSDHSAAVTLFEKRLQQPADAVFLLYAFGEALLVTERFFKVLFTGYGLQLGVDQLKSEISDDPHEAGEVLRVLLGVGLFFDASRLNLNVLG